MATSLRRRTCCFTGHRLMHPAMVDAAMRRTEDAVREAVAAGADRFCLGGAVGYDTLAAELMIRLRDTELPGIVLTLYRPFPGFSDLWPDDEDRFVYEALLPRYDDVVTVSRSWSRDAYHARDRAMVDASSRCVCYLVNPMVRTGTSYTVRYAREQGLIVRNTAG